MKAGFRSLYVTSYLGRCVTDSSTLAKSQLRRGNAFGRKAFPQRSPQVLVLDTARFKYPPHWVALAGLARAMRAADPDTGAPRGFCTLHADEPCAPYLPAPKVGQP